MKRGQRGRPAKPILGNDLKVLHVVLPAEEARAVRRAARRAGLSVSRWLRRLVVPVAQEAAAREQGVLREMKRGPSQESRGRARSEPGIQVRVVGLHAVTSSTGE